MADEPQGCARLTGAVIPDKGNSHQSTEITDRPKEKTMTIHVGQKAPEFAAPAYYQGKFDPKEKTMTIHVGQKAPEFAAPAYYQGKFNTVKLSDYSGKWLLLCFYPGDFTFV